MLDDFEGLLRWPELDRWIEAQPGMPRTGPVTAISMLTGGSQNNLFPIEREGGVAILRRPFKHIRANSNATMVREARLLGALRGVTCPMPISLPPAAART